MKISIEGNISSGKSTLLSRIQQDLRIPVFLEPLHSWTLLDKFYKDSERYGFAFNTQVLMSMFQWKNNDYNSIYERSPYSCRYVFTELQYEQKKMSKEELDLFDSLFSMLKWEQDIIIYIRTTPEICYKRMHIRNRGCEEKVSLQYLQEIDRKHCDMLEFIKLTMPHIKIYEVNGDDNADNVYTNVLKIINKYF